MWCSENEQTELKKISPSSYYLRSFCENFYYVCILLTLAVPSIAVKGYPNLVGLGEAVALSSASFFLNALLAECAEYLLLRRGLVYDYKSDTYGPTSERFTLRAAVCHVCCAAVWYLPIMLRYSWRMGRFTRVLTIEGVDQRGSVRIHLQEKGRAHLQFKFFRAKGQRGMVGRGCGETWTASPDMAQIEIRVSDSEHISLSRLPGEDSYAILAQGLWKGMTVPTHCAVVKK